jgi:molybdopterin-guanine dinucleotide biosynthesis protein
VLFERSADDYDPIALARRYMEGADLVICEGYKRAALPKIEVWRKAIGGSPLYDPAAANAGEWVALMTDDREIGAGDRCPVLAFSDTNWLQTLANIAWERALVL